MTIKSMRVYLRATESRPSSRGISISNFCQQNPVLLVLLLMQTSDYASAFRDIIPFLPAETKVSKITTQVQSTPPPGFHQHLYLWMDHYRKTKYGRNGNELVVRSIPLTLASRLSAFLLSETGFAENMDLYCYYQSIEPRFLSTRIADLGKKIWILLHATTQYLSTWILASYMFSLLPSPSLLSPPEGILKEVQGIPKEPRETRGNIGFMSSEQIPIEMGQFIQVN